MAKVVNGGNKKGKIGNSIFYTIKNSNNKVTQGERIYQPNVTNPQSESQRAQRMKMTPASNFYRALSTILDHSWEGVKYGAMSRQYFMKLAMSANQEIFPYVNKGTTFVVPGPYPISRGSLPSIAWKIESNALEIIAATGGEMESTVAAFSTVVMNANPFLREGDQLTFIAFMDLEDRETRTFMPVIGRVILNTSDERAFDEVVGSYSFDEIASNYISFSIGNFSETASLAGACIVVSRKNESGGQVWQRSAEVMAVTNELMNEWMSPAAYAGALDSYKRSESVSDSNYYLNDAETESEAAGGENYSFTNNSVDFTLGTTTETHTAVVVQNDNGPLLTCAKFGIYPEERPDGKNTWLETYIVRGRTLVLMERYNLTTDQVQSITAKYDNQTIQVLTPEAFVARFKDFTIA